MQEQRPSDDGLLLFGVILNQHNVTGGAGRVS
jgi:hypothetical protein